VFDAAHHGWAEDEFTFPADGNFPYSSSAFEGCREIQMSTSIHSASRSVPHFPRRCWRW
jgi:hypothetical protein